MFRRMISFMVFVVLIGCSESATEPEAPPGWQVVVETSSNQYKVAATVVSNTDPNSLALSTVFGGGGGNTFTADLRDGDTLLVGPTFWVFSYDTAASLRLTGDIRLSPTTRYPIALHDFTVILDVTVGDKAAFLQERVVERNPAENDALVFVYSHEPPAPPAEPPSSFLSNYGFVVLRAVTCEQEGRNVLRSNGFTVATASNRLTLMPPDVTVTCHRQVSSASVRSGSLN